MPVFVLAQITIHDRERYQRYQSGFMPIVKKYRGRLLASDEAPDLLQGAWPYQKVVIIEFEDREAAERWAHSPEYQEISKDRVAATSGVALLIHGLQ